MLLRPGSGGPSDSARGTTAAAPGPRPASSSASTAAAAAPQKETRTSSQLAPALCGLEPFTLLPSLPPGSSSTSLLAAGVADCDELRERTAAECGGVRRPTRLLLPLAWRAALRTPAFPGDYREKRRGRWRPLRRAEGPRSLGRILYVCRGAGPADCVSGGPRARHSLFSPSPALGTQSLLGPPPPPPPLAPLQRPGSGAGATGQSSRSSAPALPNDTEERLGSVTGPSAGDPTSTLLAQDTSYAKIKIGLTGGSRREEA